MERSKLSSILLYFVVLFGTVLVKTGLVVMVVAAIYNLAAFFMEIKPDFTHVGLQTLGAFIALLILELIEDDDAEPSRQNTQNQ